MILKSKENNGSIVLGEAYRVNILDNIKDARRITDFFLSENSFDDRNFTNGELIQFKNLPLQSLKDENLLFWFAENNMKEIIGVINIRENEQRTGGYFIDYIAVHKLYRNSGIAHELMSVIINYAQLQNGRYIHANTCDISMYKGARAMFERWGFEQVGHLPDYYFEGEGMIIYYKKI
jgi:ribosomal protein S18 acetylase RimI-like enzyme